MNHHFSSTLQAVAYLLIGAAIVITVSTTQAAPSTAQYVARVGDTPITLALRYNLPLTELILANDQMLPYLAIPGQRLDLPGVDLPVEQQLPEYAPDSLIPHTVQSGESLSLIARQYQVSVDLLVAINNLGSPDVLQAGQTIQIPPSAEQFGHLNAPFQWIRMSEPTIIQGRTLVINIGLTEPARLRGTFEGVDLFFTKISDNQYWGLLPVHPMIEPTVYKFVLTAITDDGAEVSTFVNFTVDAGPYGVEYIQLDGNRGSLLTNDRIQQEQEKLSGIWSQITPRPMWEGPFRYPVGYDTLTITSSFGTRRSYNDSPVSSFHGGTDFGGGVGAPIYAPAPGRVVLAEPLELRGNAVLIDHGMGLFSGYWHQSEIVVVEGQEVQPGDLIGFIGSTGLVTGPHLHWELRLLGIAVEPLQWVEETLP